MRDEKDDKCFPTRPSRMLSHSLSAISVATFFSIKWSRKPETIGSSSSAVNSFPVKDGMNRENHPPPSASTSSSSSSSLKEMFWELVAAESDDGAG